MCPYAVWAPQLSCPAARPWGLGVEPREGPAMGRMRMGYAGMSHSLRESLNEDEEFLNRLETQTHPRIEGGRTGLFKFLPEKSILEHCF